jgi:uncharacterized RDD family membrane protein YckC
MRVAWLILILATALAATSCTPPQADSASAPRLAATGNANNLYVAVAHKVDGREGFQYWQRDVRGTWHEGGAAQGLPLAVAAWREHLLVCFPSGRIGLFGLGPAQVLPAPVASWTPAAACEDGVAADVFGFSAAGDPVLARYENEAWSLTPVEAGLERDKMVDVCAARHGGRLFVLWREHVPVLTGGMPAYRLRFIYAQKGAWQGPVTSRLTVGSAPQVASDGRTLACLFRRPAAGDAAAEPWRIATYALADEDWHEVGPVEGDVPAGALALARAGDGFLLVALDGAKPAAAPLVLDVRRATAGPFTAFAAPAKPAGRASDDAWSAALMALMALVLLMLLASWRRARQGGIMTPAPPESIAYAPLVRRIAAAAIDYALVSLAATPAVLYVAPDMPEKFFRGADIPAWDMMRVQLIMLAFLMPYFIVQEGAFGRTLGKRLLGLEVRTEGGGRISWWQAVVRNLLRVVDQLPVAYLLGVSLIIIGPRPQRLGDRLARTLVVMAEPVRPRDDAQE